MRSGKERSARVVLADDHPSVRAALKRILEADCEVVAGVATGAHAVEAVIRLKPDVLVVDLMMPDLDGLEVCRQVKHASPETDVVIVTAFVDASVQTVAMQVGAAAFVPKPVAARTLGEMIRRIVENKRHDSA
jgi:DNA-binding NarL/FixJ family response regulator